MYGILLVFELGMVIVLVGLNGVGKFMLLVVVVGDMCVDVGEVSLLGRLLVSYKVGLLVCECVVML